MKKCIISAIAGALAMFVAILIVARLQGSQMPTATEYEHIDYISAITSETCFVCSENGPYRGEDNVGIVDLNTFELLYIPINRYGDHGELIEEPVGIMQTSSLMDQKTDRYVHATIFPDNAYACVDLSGVKYAIDRELVQSNLCQDCLDSINSLWFTTQPPAEYAVISFADKTIQPLLNAHPWFMAGNYGIDCEFKDNGAIDLLIHYAPNRYK